MTIAPNRGGSPTGSTTTTVASIKDTTGEPVRLYVLLDTGCSNSLISNKCLPYIKSIKKSKSHYATAGGPYKTSRLGTVTFKLPEFCSSKEISWQMDIDKGKLEELGYDMIIGRALLQALKMTIDFEYQVIKWEGTSVSMNKTKLAKIRKKDVHAIFQLATEPKTVQEATARVSRKAFVRRKTRSNFKSVKTV